MKMRKITAPALLGLLSFVLRSRRVGSATKDRLWEIAQKYATFFNVTKEVTIINGLRMHVSSGPRVEQEIFLFGEWEPLFTRYLQTIPANEGIFLDVGSNIGYFSLIACSIFDEVHAIEASPSTSRRLRNNVDANNIDNILVYTTAVGSDQGQIDFYQNKEQSGGASTIKSHNSVFEARVPIAPLEKILDGIDWGLVRFVKIDVEGLEASVLNSLFKLRDRLHPEVEIFVEYDSARTDTWPAIQAFLHNGFSIAMMQGRYDRRDYVEVDRRTELPSIDGPPEMFCDLLLRRRPA